jgi:hypothetical protein
MLRLLEKKKQYKVVWKYGSSSVDSYTEIVKAYDEAHAWQIIKREHAVAIALVNVEAI